MANKTFTVRFPEKRADQLLTRFNLQGSGTTLLHRGIETLEAVQNYADKGTDFIRACEAYQALRTVAMTELKGRFSAEAIRAMADAANGVAISPALATDPGLFWRHLTDADIHENIFPKWGVDVPLLEDLVYDMSAIACYFLQEELHQFWYGNKYGSPAPDLEKLVKILS